MVPWVFNKICWGFLAVMVLMASAAVCRAAPRPIQAPNRFPLFWMFLAPGPMPADLPGKGVLETSLAVDYSALYFQHSSDQWDVLIDMETVVIDLSATYAITPRWAVGLTLPIVSTNSGFMDVFLEGFHDTFNLPNYGREERPPNTFGFRVAKEGQLWFQGQSGQTQLADTTIFLKYQLSDFDDRQGFASLLVFGLKLPTGEPQLGFGSGAVDMGFYLPMQWWRKRWSFFLSPGATLIGSPDTGEADFGVRNTLHLSGGVSFSSSDKWHWVLQTDYHTSPLEQTGIEELDQGALQLTLGCRYTMSRGWVLDMGFSEDLAGAVPDFTVHMGLEWAYDLSN